MRSRTIRREAVPRFPLTASVTWEMLRSPFSPSGFDAYEFPLRPRSLLDPPYLDLARRFEEHLHHRLASNGPAVVTPHDSCGEKWSRGDRDSHGGERRRANSHYTRQS